MSLHYFFFYFICHSKSKRKLLDLVMLAYISDKDISSKSYYDLPDHLQAACRFRVPINC